MGKKKGPAEDKAAVNAEPKQEGAKEEEEGAAEAAGGDPPAVKELMALDEKYLEIERRCQRELQDVRRKYLEEQEPVLAERMRVLTAGTEGAEGEVRGTPALRDFWMRVLQNHPAFEDQIEEWDEPLLEYLSDITRSYRDAADLTKGFKLCFHFVVNPYFTNKCLWKEYHTEMAIPYTGECKATEVQVCEIDWKPNKNVTVEVVQSKKTKGGRGKKTAAKAREVPRDSFFRNFFRQLKLGMPIPDDMNLEEAKQLCEDSDNNDEMVELLLENDYQMGVAVRDQVIPFAIRWYANEEDSDQSTDDDNQDDSVVDAEEGSEQESPSPKPKKSGRSGGAASRAGKPGAPSAPEENCKQQ